MAKFRDRKIDKEITPAPTANEKYLQDTERLDKAIEKHEKEIKKPLEGFRNYYRGVQWAIGDSLNMYNDKIVDNIVYGIVSSFVASLYLGNVKVSVKPKTAQHVVDGKKVDASIGAMRHQVLSEFLYEELELAPTMEKVLVDAFLGHRGVVFTGFEAKTKELEEDIENEDDVGTFNRIIESESLFVDRVSPNDFLTDIDATDPDLKDSKRIYIRWVKTPDEVKEDTGKDIKPNGELEKKNQEMVFSSFKRDTAKTPAKDVWGRVEGYDLYDIDKQEIRTIVIGEDDYVQKKEWPVSYKGKFPVDILWFNYMPDSATPIADTSLYKGRQDNINIIHSKINDHVRKLADQKYAYNQQKVKREDAEKFARGSSGSTLPGKGDPNTFWSPQNDGGVSQDFYVGVTQGKRDVHGMLGVSNFESGGQTDFNSAEEAKREQAGTLPKRSFRSDKYKKFIRNVVVKLANIAAQVLPTTEIPLGEQDFNDLAKNKPELLNGRKTGRTVDGGTEIEVFPFTTVDKSLLQGDFTFNVQIIDTGPESKISKRQDATLLLQLADTNPFVNKIEALKVWFEAFDFNYLMDRLLRDPAEVAKEQQQAQQTAIQAQIAIDEPKRTTDMDKTKLKVLGSMATTGMQLDQKENEGNRKFVTANKDRETGAEVSSLDRLFSLAKGSSGNGKKDA